MGKPFQSITDLEVNAWLHFLKLFLGGFITYFCHQFQLFCGNWSIFLRIGNRKISCSLYWINAKTPCGTARFVYDVLHKKPRIVAPVFINVEHFTRSALLLTWVWNPWFFVKNWRSPHQVTSENPQLAAQTLPTRPTSSCMLLKGQRQLLEDSTKQAKLWWHNCQKLKAVSSNDIHHHLV